MKVIFHNLNVSLSNSSSVFDELLETGRTTENLKNPKIVTEFIEYLKNIHSKEGAKGLLRKIKGSRNKPATLILALSKSLIANGVNKDKLVGEVLDFLIEDVITDNIDDDIENVIEQFNNLQS